MAARGSSFGPVTAARKRGSARCTSARGHFIGRTCPALCLVVVAQTDWLKAHQDEATRYVELMLDANRQWENNADLWVDAAKKIYPEAGLNDQELHAAWQLFRDGGYFSVNGGINFAATQKVMDMFFKLRSESPNQYLAKPADLYDTGRLQAALDKMGVVKGTPGLPDVPDWDGAKAADAK